MVICIYVIYGVVGGLIKYLWEHCANIVIAIKTVVVCKIETKQIAKTTAIYTIDLVSVCVCVF